MKKIVLSFLILIVLIGTTCSVYASNVNAQRNNNQRNETNIIGTITQMKEDSQKELDEYIEKYGSESYGITAMVLKKVQVYSIPFCFLGVAISAIYQYVIGIRKLDTRDKGFYSLVGFVTIFVICQVLPLVFAIVVKGWRG